MLPSSKQGLREVPLHWRCSLDSIDRFRDLTSLFRCSCCNGATGSPFVRAQGQQLGGSEAILVLQQRSERSAAEPAADSEQFGPRVTAVGKTQAIHVVFAGVRREKSQELLLGGTVSRELGPSSKHESPSKRGGLRALLDHPSAPSVHSAPKIHDD